MALKLNERYPGRFNNPSPEYPQGSFKNRTAPSAKDGSYLEKDWANDKEGFFQSLLSKSGYVANGLVDKVGSSQYYDALVQTIKDKAEVAWAKVTGTPTTLSGYGINNAYTSVQVDNLLKNKLSRDSIVSAGFQNNNPNLPYMLRESDMGMYFLQPRLGFTPIQQGGGVGQLQNTIKIGYSLEGVRITIDESDAGVIWTSGNFNPASKADATAVAQATEVGRGTARVAAIADVNAGVDDAAFVTSKKLRWGFSASLAINGYIALPSWLGGLVIQWGRSDLAGSQFGNVAFPVAFPNNGFIALAVDAVIAGNPSTLSAVGVTVPTTAGFSLVSASASAAGIQMWAAIGN